MRQSFDPRDRVGAKLQRAKDYMRGRRYTEALPLIQELAQACPRDPQYVKLLSDCLSKMGLEAVGDQTLKQALRPTYLEGVLEEARALFDADDIDECMRKISVILQSDKDNLPALTLKTRCLERRKQSSYLDKWLSSVEKRLVNKVYMPAFQMLGELINACGESEKTSRLKLEIMEAAIHDKAYLEDVVRTVNNFLHTRDFDKAVGLISSVVNMLPEWEEGRDLKVECLRLKNIKTGRTHFNYCEAKRLFGAGNFDSALKKINEVISDDPEKEEYKKLKEEILIQLRRVSTKGDDDSELTIDELNDIPDSQRGNFADLLNRLKDCEQSKDHATALKLIDEGIRRYPEISIFPSKKIYLFLEMYRLAEARVIAEEFYRSFGNYISCLMLARVVLKQEDEAAYPAIRALLSNICNEQPDNREAHGYLSTICWRMKDELESLEHARLAQEGLDNNGSTLRYIELLVNFGRGQEAIEVAKKVVSYHPDAWAYTNLAKVYLRLNNLRQAHIEALFAIRLGGGQHSYSTFANILMAEKRYDLAEACLKYSIKNMGGDGIAFSTLAKLNLHRGRPVDAIEPARLAYEDDSDPISATLYGKALLFGGQPEKAWEIVSQYLNGKSDDRLCLLAAKIQSHLKNYHLVEEYAEAALVANPENVIALSVKMFALMRQKKYIQALAQYRKNLSEGLFVGLPVLLKSAMATGNMNEALQLLEETEKVSSKQKAFGKVQVVDDDCDSNDENDYWDTAYYNEAYIYNWRAKVYLYFNEYDKAEVWAQKAMTLSPNSYSQSFYAQILLGKGDYERAAELVKSALSKDSHPGLYVVLIQIYLAWGKVNMALAAVDEALTKHRRDAFVGLKMEIFRKLKRYAAVLNEVKNLQNMNYSSYLCLAYTYKSMIKFDLAWENLEQARQLAMTEVASDENGYDWRVRLYGGYLFLFEIMQGENCTISRPLLDRCREAKKWLISFDNKKIGKTQKFDFECALKIAQSIS